MIIQDTDLLKDARQKMALKQLEGLVFFYAVGVLGLLAAGLFLGESEAVTLALINMGALGVIWTLKRLGQVTLSIALLTFSLLGTAIWGTWTTTWGLVDSTMVLFAVTVVISSLSLPKRLYSGFLSLTMLAVLFVGFRTRLGLARDFDIGRTQAIDVAVVVITLLIIAFCTRRQNNALWTTLHRATENELDLRDSYLALEAQSERLGAAERRWRSLMEASPNWILQLNREGKVIYSNHDGLFPDGALGQRITDLMDPDDQREATPRIEEVLAGGPAQALEYDVRTAEGERRCVFHLGPLREGGLTEGAIAMVSDVTERRQMSEELQQSRKLESIGQLAGGIAHDFNNLLTVIGGHADLAGMKLPEGHEVAEDLEVIERAVENASALTRQILAFSRRQALRPRPVDLAETIQGMHRMLIRLIREDIELVESLEENLPAVMADPGSLEQVILNLVVNARDAIRQHPDPAAKVITLTTRQVQVGPAMQKQIPGLETGSYLELAVNDTGVGMEPEIKSRIFEPFFTTKATGEGTGLGLATVYGIVQQSGGACKVYSEPGLGTSFKIFWPATEDMPVSPTDSSSHLEDLKGSEHILVVEDDPAVRQLATASLRSMGYKVSVVNNADQALGMLPHLDDVALVFTDVVMPGLTGFELKARLPENLPVLFTSGYADGNYLPDGKLPEEAEFLQKPYGTLDLARKIRGLLNPG